MLLIFSRSHDREIIINNKVFEKIKTNKNPTVNITEVFILYFNLLLRLAWNDTIDTTGQILLNQLKREKRYMKNINTILSILGKSGLVDVQNNDYKRNDVISIRAIVPRENFTRLRCINEQIIHLPGPPKPCNLISVFCYLKIKENNPLSRAKVSLEKISLDLGLSPGTVNKSTNRLFENGFLSINFGKYNTTENRYSCHTYKTYDYDNPIDNRKYLQIKKGFKEKKILLQDIESNAILELLLQEIRGNNINKLLSTIEMCPALLVGKYAEEFRDSYKGKIRSLENANHLKEIVQMYEGLQSTTGKYLVIDNISYLNKPNQDILLSLVENSKIPIILLSDYENVSPILLSRIKFIFKDPLNKVIAASYMPPHRAFEKTNKFKNQQHKLNYMAEKSPKTFCLESYQLGRDKGSQNVDSLISKLSGGRTHREIWPDELEGSLKI